VKKVNTACKDARQDDEHKALPLPARLGQHCSSHRNENGHISCPSCFWKTSLKQGFLVTATAISIAIAIAIGIDVIDSDWIRVCHLNVKRAVPLP
jgi:hypothetical protein